VTRIFPSDWRGAGRRRHLRTNKEPALSRNDSRLSGLERGGRELVGDLAGGAPPLGNQCGSDCTGGALPGAQIRGRISGVQSAGAAVGLIGAVDPSPRMQFGSTADGYSIRCGAATSRQTGHFIDNAIMIADARRGRLPSRKRVDWRLPIKPTRSEVAWA
jgi:hypothetical protein